MRLPDDAGRSVLLASWIGTAALLVTAVPAAIDPGAFRIPAATVALILFAVGCILFLWAFARGVERSRHEEVAVPGLYFLAGDVAPGAVKAHLFASLAIQTVIAVVTASVRPFTSLAFGILVPMYGLGLAGQWAARYGRFARRRELRRRKPKAR